MLGWNAKLEQTPSATDFFRKLKDSEVHACTVRNRMGEKNNWYGNLYVMRGWKSDGWAMPNWYWATSHQYWDSTPSLLINTSYSLIYVSIIIQQRPIPFELRLIAADLLPIALELHLIAIELRLIALKLCGLCPISLELCPIAIELCSTSHRSWASSHRYWATVRPFTDGATPIPNELDLLTIKQTYWAATLPYRTLPHNYTVYTIHYTV